MLLYNKDDDIDIKFKFIGGILNRVQIQNDNKAHWMWLKTLHMFFFLQRFNEFIIFLLKFIKSSMRLYPKK